MALVRWDPWNDMLALQREMADMVRRMFGEWQHPLFGQMGMVHSWYPAVDVFARDGDLVVRAELPGIDPEKDVEILLEDDVLTIRGERRRETTTDGGRFFRSETVYGAFERRIPVPEGVTEKDIRASYVNGVLEVVVPRAVELRQAKRIPVTSGHGRKALTGRGTKK